MFKIISKSIVQQKTTNYYDLFELPLGRRAKFKE